jgi:putative hydrolase of the HAD superfamily
MDGESMKGIKAVLFDLDETLTDAQMGLKSAHAAVAEELLGYLRREGIIVQKERITLKLQKLDDEKNIQRDYNRDSWWPELLAEFGVKQLRADFSKKLTKLYWSEFARANIPYPDAADVLFRLKQKGYSLALVTDTDGTPGAKLERIKSTPLLSFFDIVVVGGEDTELPKPDPAVFLLAASKLGVSPEECVMIGDKPFTDIRGAKAAGMRTIRIKRREWRVKEDADITLTSLTELLKFLG